MILDIPLHPDAEAAITALRLTQLGGPDGKTLNYADNEALAIDIVYERLVKEALARFPPADMATTLKAAQAAFDAVAKGEFDKRLKAGVVAEKASFSAKSKK